MKKLGLTNADKGLLSKLNEQVDHAEEQLRVNAVPGNPVFSAQFDVQVSVKYFTESADVYTSRTAAYVLANAATLATILGCFMFGQSDYAAGFKKSMEQFPLTNWTYGTPFTYGRDYANCAFGALDATVTAQLQRGDVVIPMTAVSGANYLALVILRCPQVGYAKLLDSLSSDRFWINTVRYILTDTTAAGLLQYDNEIKVQMQSLFGLFNENSVSPTSFKQPDQFQNGIIDVPIDQGVDKNITVNTYINYDSVSQKFSFFVRQFDRLKA